MARVLQKILAVADVDVLPSERKSKISGYLTNFSDLLLDQDYHGCLRHVSAIITELEPQYANQSGPSTLVDVLLARSALNFKLGHFDDCFSDAQKALRRDRVSLVAFHLSFLALRELGELVKALAYLCKCYSLASLQQRGSGAARGGDQAQENNQYEGSKNESGRLSAHGDTLDIISQANLTDSKNLRMDTLRTELFHFALRTIQHVPDALDAASSAVAPTDLPGVLTGIARQLTSKGQHELSSYCLEAVIVLCKKASSDVKPTLLCALESLAQVYATLNLHERALAMLARHQTLATEMENWAAVAVASALQAKAHRAMGNLQQCEQCLHDRLDVLRTYDHSNRQSQLDLLETELQVADVCRRQLRLHAALGHGEAALALSRQVADRPSLIKCHEGLGRLRMLLGLYPEAVFHFKTSLTVARKAQNIVGQSWALLGLAEVYAGLQRYPMVLDSCKLLLALPAVTPTCDDVSESSLISLDDVVRHDCRCRALLVLGTAHQNLKQLDKAAALIEEARLEADLMKDPSMLGHVNCAAGSVATDTGTFMTAYRHLTAAMDLAKSTEDPVLQMQCHYHLGVAATRGKLKQQPTAVEHFYSAINLFSELRERYGSFSPDGSKIVDLPLDCYECLQEVLVNRGDIKEAFLVAEHTQQRMYLDMVGVHQDLEDLQPIRSLPLKMPTLNSISRSVSASGSGVILYSLVHDSLYMWLCLPPRGLAAGVFAFHKWPPKAVHYLIPFLRQNYFLLSRLPSNIRDANRMCEARSCCLVGGEAMMYRSEASGQMSESQGDPPPYCPYGSIAQRQQLSYPWVGDDDLIHPGRSSYLSAPAPLDDNSVIGTESRASMRDLYDILAMPFERYLFGYGSLPVKDLVIVAQNSILLCPFSALVTSRRVVVCDFYQFRLQPCLLPPVVHSVKTCEQCIASNAEQKGVVALLCGNPTVPTVKFYGQTWRPLPLPYAEREVRSVGLLLGPAVHPLLGVAARRHTLLSAMPQATLIHLAVHLSWELSSFVVAPAAGVTSPTEKDVLITASDISRLHLQADLVILSGGSAYCHSTRPGAGLPQPNQHNLPSHVSMMTLARAFLTAGARCVLVSLWSIPDRATDEFMFLFYENIKRGVCVGLALRETMEAVRTRRGFTEPVHWASFVHFGKDITLDFSTIEGVPLPSSALAASQSRTSIGVASTAGSASATAFSGAAESTVSERAASSRASLADSHSVQFSTGTAGSAGPERKQSTTSSTLVEVDNMSVSSIATPGGRLVLRRSGSSFAHRRVFESVKCFTEAVSSVVSATHSDDEAKAAVDKVLKDLSSVIKHSANVLAQLPSGPNSPGASNVPTRSTPALADSGYGSAETLASSNGKVHGLLVSLGFVSNHNSEADDYNLHFSDSQYFSPMHAAVILCLEALEAFLSVAPSSVAKLLVQALPVDAKAARGLLQVIKNPTERPCVTAGSLCGIWNKPQCQSLLESLGFHETTSTDVDASAATASAIPESVDTVRVLALDAGTGDKAVLSSLSHFLSLLSGDISIAMSSLQLGALSRSAWVDDGPSDGSASSSTTPAAGSDDADLLGDALPTPGATSTPGTPVAATAATATSPNAIDLNWESLLDSSPMPSRVASSLSSPLISIPMASGVASSRSDSAIISAGQQETSSNGSGSNVFDVNALLMELGINLPAGADSSSAGSDSGTQSVCSGPTSLAAVSFASDGAAANSCASDPLGPLDAASAARSGTNPIHMLPSARQSACVEQACQSLSSASLSGSENATHRDASDLSSLLSRSAPLAIPDSSADAADSGHFSASADPEHEPLQREGHSASPRQDSGSSGNRSWKSLSRMMSLDNGSLDSPGSPLQARCDHCQTKFGLLRWRHICSFCARELCHSCFDTDPATGRKDSSASGRDTSLCVMCWLATGTGHQ
ncbi:tetratricopeptide repeat protein 28-like [Sycon ciliatum]|uniref:tetratricopeptide repeat protein 28-like n=1 Tax=Sycon ciliatum TaxID=27933 RepID=UPI0031F60824